MAQDQIWTTPETANYLKLSERFLEDLRRRGGGPVFVQFGRAVRYRRADVDAWAASRVKRSTSDQGEAVR